MTLPLDIARCRGVGSDEDGWREGCEGCLRRTCRPEAARVSYMGPPPSIAFLCEYYIAPVDAAVYAAQN